MPLCLGYLDTRLIQLGLWQPMTGWPFIMHVCFFSGFDTPYMTATSLHVVLILLGIWHPVLSGLCMDVPLASQVFWHLTSGTCSLFLSPCLCSDFWHWAAPPVWTLLSLFLGSDALCWIASYSMDTPLILLGLCLPMLGAFFSSTILHLF